MFVNSFRAAALVVLLCISTVLFSQNPELYSRARVWTPGTSITEVAALGICVDHGHYRKGVYLECDFSQTEIARMQQAGFTVDVLIEDVAAYYAKRGQEPADNHQSSQKAAGNCTVSTSSFPTPLGFGLGSMGGYFTYQEMLTRLDSMSSQFPDLITPKMAIDTFLTHQGRPIYYMSMTSQANPGLNKPQVLYTAVHHAREPASMSQLLYYMYYLLENYGTDAEATYLLDNAELVFVPCLNPDGYIRNQTLSPNGGGLWRKNYRDNGNGEYGVDLNRNYGYEWGYDDTGSSPDPGDDTYRGPSGFSEPESQAIEFLCFENDFKVALNHHTYGNLLIYPWGFEAGLLTPDSTIFINLAKWMTKENGFVYGTGDQTVGYTTNGDSDDWMYGEQTGRGKTFAMTPESGEQNDGFWPAQNRIFDICASNVFQNLTAARFVLNYGVAEDLSTTILPSLSGGLEISLTRLSLDASMPLTVSMVAVSGNIASVSAPQVVTNLASYESDTLSIAYTLNAGTQPGDEVQFRLLVSNGFVTTEDTLNKVLGPVLEVFADSAATAALWTGGTWNTTATSFVSAPFSFADSPNGDYQPGTSNSYVLDTLIDLTNAYFAQLQYQAQWSIEPGYDYAQLEAALEGSNTWQPLCGNYTKLGNNNQDENEPLYDGYSNGWVLEEVDLTDFLGEKIKLRFRMRSDNFVEDDGFYFDDLRVVALNSPVDTTDSLTTIAIVDVQPTLTLYPNPASGKAMCSFTASPVASYIVCHNLLGEEVMRLPVPARATTAHMNIEQLPAGVYLVRHLGSEVVQRLVVGY